MKKSKFTIGNGIISIFLIFICLCLTCFCVLTFLSASVDKKYTDKRTEETDKYYAADKKARLILKEIDEAVSESLSNDMPLDFIAQIVDEMEDVSVQVLGDTMNVSYQVAIDDDKNIAVSIGVDKEGKFSIESWNTVANTGIIIDEPLNLWDGQ